MSNKFDWKSLVGTVAPTLATALGGPMAGMTTKAIATALKLDSSASDLDFQIEQRLSNASHTDLLALKNADLDFKVRMRELEIEEKDLHFKDMANARESHKDSHKPFVIFLILTAVSCGGFWYIVENIDSLHQTTVGMLLPIYGGVVAKWMDTIAYHVGTTWASARKSGLTVTTK